MPTPFLHSLRLHVLKLGQPDFGGENGRPPSFIEPIPADVPNPLDLFLTHQLPNSSKTAELLSSPNDRESMIANGIPRLPKYAINLAECFRDVYEYSRVPSSWIPWFSQATGLARKDDAIQVDDVETFEKWAYRQVHIYSIYLTFKDHDLTFPKRETAIRLPRRRFQTLKRAFDVDDSVFNSLVNWIGDPDSDACYWWRVAAVVMAMRLGIVDNYVAEEVKDPALEDAREREVTQELITLSDDVLPVGPNDAVNDERYHQLVEFIMNLLKTLANAGIERSPYENREPPFAYSQSLAELRERVAYLEGAQSAQAAGQGQSIALQPQNVTDVPDLRDRIARLEGLISAQQLSRAEPLGANGRQIRPGKSYVKTKSAELKEILELMVVPPGTAKKKLERWDLVRSNLERIDCLESSSLNRIAEILAIHEQEDETLTAEAIKLVFSKRPE